jgi:hypothetical protein
MLVATMKRPLEVRVSGFRHSAIAHISFLKQMPSRTTPIAIRVLFRTLP